MKLTALVTRTATLLSGSAGSQVIILASLPLVTRLYTPSELGVGELFIAVLTILMGISAGRFEYAVLLVRRHAVESIVAVSLLVGLVVATLGGSGIFVYFSTTNLTSPFTATVAAVLMFIGISMASMLLPARLYLLRLSKLRVLARLFLLRGSLLALLRVGFGALGLGVVGYFLAETLALTLLMIFTVTAGRGWGRLRLPSRGDISAVWGEHRRFLQFETPATLLNTSNIFAPLVIVSIFFGSAAAGVYALAFRLVMAPVNQVAMAAGDVFQTTAARHIRARRYGRFRVLCAAFLGALIVVSIIAILGLLVLTRYIEWFFGEGWASVALILPILAPWMAAAIIVTPMSRLVSISGKQHWKLISDIIRFVAVFGSVPIIAARPLELREALILLSAANVASYIVYAIVILKIVLVLGSTSKEIQGSKNA